MAILGINAESWAELNDQLEAMLDVPHESGPVWTIPKLQLELTDGDRGPGIRCEQPGDLVGPYRVVRELATGGMGTVWLAERSDGVINRPVALKLPRGAWRHGVLAERMARERQILATLNHPNIARLYDAGFNDDGQPYLALEYVDGCPVDQYCKENRLDLRRLLNLFLQVLNAVAHAHSRLVVHRDLKPPNILVTRDGQARLLDFGIAKLLEQGAAEETELTERGGRALSPNYASPEQIAGGPIGIASDIYSLGVVLYELLTGIRPYKLRRDSRGALEDAILEAAPARPSEVADSGLPRKDLRGDLDVIVLKALKKDPEERYLTVNAFADDIERYLHGRPVLARRDGAWYRCRKFIGRNRFAVGAATLILATVIGGAGLALREAQVARSEKRTADEVKQFITSMFRDVDPYPVSGKALSAVDLLKQAKDKIERLSGAKTELRVELLNLVASSLIGLEDMDGAEAVLRQALDEAQRGLPRNHAQTLHAQLLMAQVHGFLGRTEEMRHALEQATPALRRNPETYAEDLVLALENRGRLAIDVGEYDKAQSAAKEALDLALARLGERDPRTVDALMLLAESYQSSDARADVALGVAERAFRLATNVYRDRPKHPRMIGIRHIYGLALARAGQINRGVAEMQQAASEASEVFGSTSRELGLMLGNLSRFQRLTGKLRASLANSSKGLDICARYSPRDSFAYVEGLTVRGVTWLAARRGTEALRDLSESADTLSRTFGPSHDETLLAQYNRALALAYLGRMREAEKQIGPAVALYLSTYRDPIYKPHRPLYVLGVVKRLTGDPTSALETERKALSLVEKDLVSDWESTPILAEIGLSQLDLEQYDEAVISLRKAEALFRKLQESMTPSHAEALTGLGRAKMALGNPEEALSLLQEADRFWAGFDANNRSAGEAAFWLGQCYRSLGRNRAKLKTLRRAADILSRSPIPSDSKLVQIAVRR